MHADALVAPPNDAHAAVCRLEAELLKHPQVELPIEHEFCAGVYARSMFIPAGTAAVGAIHRSENFFVVRKGHLIVHTEDGPMEFLAGHMCATKAGTKRAVVAVTDVIVTTFHANPTNEKEPRAIWDLFTIPQTPLVSEGGAA